MESQATYYLQYVQRLVPGHYHLTTPVCFARARVCVCSNARDVIMMKSFSNIRCTVLQIF